MGEEPSEVDAWLDRLIGELVRLDAARPHEIRGCTDEEVRRIRAECPFDDPPLAYLAFLRRCGRSAGNLFRGSDLHYPACLGLREYAEECRREEDANVPTGERFFFGHHQGYVLYYFMPGDARVWSYTLAGDGAEVAASGFPSFVTGHLSIPERFWRRFRERDERSPRA